MFQLDSCFQGLHQMQSEDRWDKRLPPHHPNWDWDVQIFLRTFGGTAIARARAREHINPHFCVYPPRCYLLLSSLTLSLFCWGRCHRHCQSTCRVVFTASVMHITRGAHASWRLRLFLLLVFAVFVDPNARIIGDQGNDFARSASWLHSSHLCCGDWCTYNDNCHCKMSFVISLTMLSWCSCHVCLQGRLVTSRRCLSQWPPLLRLRYSCCERFGASQWEWCWLRSAMLMSLLIVACHDCA